MSKKSPAALAAVAVLSAAALAMSSGAALAAPLPRTAAALSSVLPSVTPGWAKTAKVLASTPDDQAVYVLLTLRGKDVAGEQAYGTAASTPGNALYRQWLTKDQFKQQFAPDSSAATAVTATLKGLGVTNVVTDAMGASVLAVMPAATAASLFKVTFAQVSHLGASLRVAMNQPTLPGDLGDYVSVVSGLTENPVHLNHTTKVPVAEPAVTTPPIPVGGAPTAYFNASPTSTYYGSTVPTLGAYDGATKAPAAGVVPAFPQLSGDTSTVKPYVTSGYTPPQIRGAYGVDAVNGVGGVRQTGKGVTAGVVLFYSGADVASDLTTFSTRFGLAAPNYTDISPYNEVVTTGAGSAPVVSPADAAGEQTLDVEAIHQMAPDASIVYSGAAAPLDAPIDIAETNAFVLGGAQVINNSFGGTGEADSADQMAFAAITDMAKTMGVGIDFSSGDAGDNVTGNGAREGDSNATSDGVTAVGGTGIQIGRANDYEGEYYWGTYSTGAIAKGDTAWGPLAPQAGGAGGGGGVSTSFPEPAWQKGIVPDSEAYNADTVNDYTTANGSAPAYGTAAAPGRVEPDVAMIADSTTGILVGETQIPDYTAANALPNQTASYSYYRIGGTSVSSPIFTGMMALVDEALGKSAGFVNPTMYPFLAKKDGAFRDPQVGRSATGSRLGSTEAQLTKPCPATAGDPYCITGAVNGPGSVPVTAEVRSDYTDTGNDGKYTPSTVTTIPDPTGIVGAQPVAGLSVAGNPVVSHLRGQGITGTLEDLPGYDDSTGLGSPYAPQFIADFLAAGTPVNTPSLPETSAPVALVLVGGVLGLGAVTLRRRRRLIG